MDTVFANRVAVLATMHQKERAIAPILETELGLQVVVPQGFDTDQFGTFTRDIPRAGDQRQAAYRKAKAALELTHRSLALASEGAFAPHPAFPYLAYNREIVLLLDLEHDLEIVGEAVSTETNYSHKVISTLEDAMDFAMQVGFPEHGLVVMPVAGAAGPIVKGITTEARLRESVLQGLAQSSTGQLHLETDMRAMYNPSRMQAIAAATQNLIQKVRQGCPNCNSPGFDISEYRAGLPCQICHLPTALTRSVLYHCRKCGFTQENLYPDGITAADPAHCSYCNP